MHAQTNAVVPNARFYLEQGENLYSHEIVAIYFFQHITTNSVLNKITKFFKRQPMKKIKVQHFYSNIKMFYFIFNIIHHPQWGLRTSLSKATEQNFELLPLLLSLLVLLNFKQYKFSLKIMREK